MKSKIILSMGLLMFILSISSGTMKAVPTDTLRLLCEPGLQNLSQAIVAEYGVAHPGTFINMYETYKPTSPADAMGSKCIAIVSEGGYPDEDATFKILIGRDVTVPLVSDENPFFEIFNKKGINPAALASAVSGQVACCWGSLLAGDQSEPVRFYVLDDKAVHSAVSAFLNLTNDDMINVEVKSAEEIKQILAQDKYAVCFNRFINMAKDDDQLLGAKLLPIDKNGSGSLEYHEKIYGSLTNFSRGIWIGKYPHTLTRNIYAVGAYPVESEETKALMNWLITDGQKVMEVNGFSELAFNERQSELDQLNQEPLAAETQDMGSVSNIYLILIAGFLIVIIAAGLYSWSAGKAGKKIVASAAKNGAINENSFQAPNGLYFDKTHTWSFMEKDGNVRIGIDDFLQKVTGRFTAVRMKEPGSRVMKNEKILTLVQDGKQLNIYAPVSGIIREINEELVTSPSLINESPFDNGWVYIIEPSNWQRETGFLSMADNYREWLRSEFRRLKDFLAATVNKEHVPHEQIVLQEGGEIEPWVLQNLNPRVWEDFQKEFIDNSDLN